MATKKAIHWASQARIVAKKSIAVGDPALTGQSFLSLRRARIERGAGLGIQPNNPPRTVAPKPRVDYPARRGAEVRKHRIESRRHRPS